MIIHAVIFTWKDGVTRADVEGVAAALDDMRPSVAGLLSLDHGPDLALRPGNGSYLLVARFQDEAAWRAYQSNPAHKRVVSEVISPLLASRVATQVEGERAPC